MGGDSTTLRGALRLALRPAFWGSLAIVGVTGAVLSEQVSARSDFANSELHRDVMDRWGAPIVQAVPSVRYVERGAVWGSLRPLPFSGQRVSVDAVMNYRKRGLVYFSGFDFGFQGDYIVSNEQPYDIEVAFVFPIDLERNRVLLSDLQFSVDGEAVALDLDTERDKLVWTGPIDQGASRAFRIGYRGRGLDTFTYLLDPDLPVEDLSLDIRVEGGDRFDYPAGVLSAAQTRLDGDTITLGWSFDSLESGVPLGLILPSEKSFDAILITMVRRSWATFLLFFAGVAVLGRVFSRPLSTMGTLIAASCYTFFFVLLAYLGAFVHFYAAFALTVVIVGGLLIYHLRRRIGERATRPSALVVGSTLVFPAFAALVPGYTGLLYCVEALMALVAVVHLSAHPTVRAALSPATGSEEGA